MVHMRINQLSYMTLFLWNCCRKRK